MRLNIAQTFRTYTHEGAPAARISDEAQLRRLVMSCLLWENEFYVDGVDIAKQIAAAVCALLRKGGGEAIYNAAMDAKVTSNLRHVPLYIAAVYAAKTSGDPNVKNLVSGVVRRADELAEFLAIYATVIGVEPSALRGRIPAQVKKGLADAFTKFDAYQLRKYDRAGPIRLLDVARLVHPPHTEAIGQLVAGTLPLANTWETRLSSGEDKRAVFEGLLAEGKLGYMALLRNLRNMDEAGVAHHAIKSAIRARRGADKVLPFRFISAANHAPWAVDALDDAMMGAIKDTPRFNGVTWILIDISGSMRARVSAKSQLDRVDAAAGLAAIWPGEKRVILFADRAEEAPGHSGLGLISAVRSRIGSVGYGTNIGGAVRSVEGRLQKDDRMVVVTDEQSATRVFDPPVRRAYMINVASARNGVGYGAWTHIDGWSEGAIRFVRELEADARANDAD